MGRKIVVSLDESDSSRHAVHWALTNAATPEDHLHLVTVLPPSVYAVAPIAPAAAGASVFAMSQSYEAVRRRDEQEAQEVLQRGVALAVEAHKASLSLEQSLSSTYAHAPVNQNAAAAPCRFPAYLLSNAIRVPPRRTPP